MNKKKNKVLLVKRNTAKGTAYANQCGRKLFIGIGAVVLALFLIQMFFEPTFALGATGSGLSMASLLALASIEDVSDRDTHGSAISYIVYMVHISQLDRTKAFPQPDKDRKVGALQLKTGESPFFFEAHDIPTLVSTTEKGDITTSGENNFVIIMGGDRDAIKNFIEQYSGGKFILIYKHVKEDQWHILGELERPMILANTETKDDKDGRYTTFTFTRQSVDLPLLYDADPSGVTPAAQQEENL